MAHNTLILNVQDGFGNILYSLSVLNPLTYGFRLSISSLRIGLAHLKQKLPEPVVVCDYAMCSLCLTLENHYLA